MSLTDEREQQIFCACLELPPAGRAEYLDRACAADPELRRRLERLLAAHGRAEQSTLDPLGEALAAQGPASGATIGPYRLIRLLAEGGMGSVWLAERTDGMVNRPIALKLPRGTWLQAQLAARMAREREILATLTHPNVARLYDAGLTAEGRPYLALEYVEGSRIDDYCSERRLDPRARLGLFIQVAEAVAHAHAKLVVHRDLKPANILVTADGQVKLLDFGIAKLLGDGEVEATALTQVGSRVLTPAYASPEQVAGAPVTVASDVYSLGVVLYELLSGVSPYRTADQTRGSLEDAVLRTDARRPSDVAAEPAFRKALRGDLDTVVLKALKKKPEERYPTVNAFAEDVQRYLEGRPVVAQPDSRRYRLRRFVGRNKVAVGAAAAVLVAILAGAGVAVWQARVALAEKRRAEEVKDFVASMFRDANPYQGQTRTLAAGDILRQARDRIDRVSADRPEMRVELLNLVGSSLIGLGDTEGAEAIAAQALDEAKRRLRPDDPLAIQARLLNTEVHRYRGRTAEMRRELDELLPMVRAAAGARPEDLVRTLENHAHVALDDGHYEEARRAAGEAFALSRRTLGESHPRTVAASNTLAEAVLALAGSNTSPKEALDETQRALALASAVYAADPRHPHVIHIREVHGRALALTGDFPRAIEQSRQAMADAAIVFGADSQTVGFFAGNVATSQRWIGDIKGSLESSNRALAILARHAQHESFTNGIQYTNRGVTWLAARRGKEALDDLLLSEAILGKATGPTSWDTLTARFNGAIALACLGRVAEARAALQLVRDGSPHVSNRMWALYVVGVVERLAGDPGAALRAQEESFALIAEGPRAPWNRVRSLAEQGLSRLELGDHEAAAVPLQRAQALFAELRTVMHPARAEVLVGLGRVRLAQGDAAQALPLLEEADLFWRNFDAGNRWAGEAALWLGRGYAALGRPSDARRALARAETILVASPIPGDAKRVKLARRR